MNPRRRRRRWWGRARLAEPARVAAACAMSATIAAGCAPAAAACAGVGTTQEEGARQVRLLFVDAQGQTIATQDSREGTSAPLVGTSVAGERGLAPRGWAAREAGGTVIPADATLEGTLARWDRDANGTVSEGEGLELLGLSPDGTVTLEALGIPEGSTGAGETVEEPEAPPAVQDAEAGPRTDDEAERTAEPADGVVEEEGERTSPPAEQPKPEEKAEEARGEAETKGDEATAQQELPKERELADERGRDKAEPAKPKDARDEDPREESNGDEGIVASAMRAVGDTVSRAAEEFRHPTISYDLFYSDARGHCGWTGYKNPVTNNNQGGPEFSALTEDVKKKVGDVFDCANAGLSAIKIKLTGGSESDGKVEYKLQYRDGSTSEWRSNGEVSGSKEDKRGWATGVILRLTGPITDHYRLLYNVHGLNQRDKDGNDTQGKAVNSGPATHNGAAVDGLRLRLFVNEHDVTFKSGLTGKLIERQKVQYHSDAKPPEPPKEKGHTFEGWVGDYQPVLRDTEVVARYREHSYTIRFEGNGADSGSMAPMTLKYTESRKLPANEFRKRDYKFLGWQRKGSGIRLSDQRRVQGLCEGDGEVITLQAIWAVGFHTLTVDPNGGSWMGSTEPSAIKLGDAETYRLDSPVWAGHSFKKWKCSQREAIFDGTTITMGTKDVRLTADWGTNTYQVKFDPNASDAKGKIDDLKATYGEGLQLPKDGFTRQTHVLAGWNTKADGSGTRYGLGDTAKNLTEKDGETVTLYAQWEPRQIDVVVPVSIGYVASSDGTLSGPANDVVAIENHSEMPIHVSRIETVAEEGLSLTTGEPDLGQIALSMTPGTGEPVSLATYSEGGGSPERPADWTLGASSDLFLNDLRGKMGDLSAHVREAPVGAVKWTFAVGSGTEGSS